MPLGIFGPGTFDERGLLGVAFHPNYAVNGKLYTYTSEPNAGPPTFPTTMPPGTPPDHQNVVAEWRAVAPGGPVFGVDPTSRRELLREDHPQFNHDGGDLAFGPDGMLYISDGDGGEADDQGAGHVPGGNAQQLTSPLGKVLRIDVNGSNSANGQYGIPADNPFVGVAGALREIYAFGFRNPFRFSFDRGTGALYLGDVGQNDIEEVDIVVKGGNYGWATKEGTLFFFNNGAGAGFASTTDNGLVPQGAIDPIAQYDTHHEGHSVIGGFVYRGSKFPQLAGRYVFGDFARLFRFPAGPNDSGRLFYLTQKNTKPGLRQINELYVPGQPPPGQQQRAPGSPGGRPTPRRSPPLGQVIVAAELTQDANDLQQPEPMLATAAATLGAAGVPQRRPAGGDARALRPHLRASEYAPSLCRPAFPQLASNRPGRSSAF